MQLEPHVAVGPDRIIETGNYRIACYTRSGQLLWNARLSAAEVTTWSQTKFWDGLGNEGAEDSKVIYDQFSNRFVVITMGIIPLPGTTTHFLCLAVSKNSSPGSPVGSPEGGSSGDWDKFVVRIDADSGMYLPFDWPQLAVNQNWIWVTGLLRRNVLGGSRHVILALRRPPTSMHEAQYYDVSIHADNKLELHWDAGALDGAVSFQFKQPAPTHFFGTMTTDTMYFVQYWDADGGLGTRYRLSALTLNADATVANLSRKEFDAEPGVIDIAQGFNQRCPTDPLVGNIPHINVQNAVWRGSKLYFARISWAADAYGNRFTAAWHIVTTNGWPNGAGQPSVEFGVLDSGRVFDTVSESNTNYPVHYVYPCVMPTALGDMALFVTRVISTGNVDMLCTGRRADDPSGQLGAPVTIIKAGEAGVSNPARWGDFEGIALDPNDANRVWVSGEVGRCPSSGDADTECPACPTSGPDCVFVDCFSSAIGSYTVSHKPTGVLSLHRQVEDPQGPIPIKIMPMDMAGAADQTLTSDVTYNRRYGYGTSVTLLVPKTVSTPSGTDQATFKKWVLDENEVVPPPGGNPRALTIIMVGDHTAVPVYTP